MRVSVLIGLLILAPIAITIVVSVVRLIAGAVLYAIGGGREEDED